MMFDSRYAYPASTSAGSSGPSASEDIKTLEQMFPNLDRGVLLDVYSSCDQDVQRSSLMLLNLTSPDGDVTPDDLLNDPYHTTGGMDHYQLGSTSLADWAATLESLSWEDTVKAVTGTLSSIGANVLQGVNTLAGSLQQLVSEISGQPSSPSSAPTGSGRDSYASTSYDDPSPHRSSSPFALGSSRVTQRHTIAVDGELLPTSPGPSSSGYVTKKDD